MVTGSSKNEGLGLFPDTSWTMIHRARDADPEVAAAALGRLAVRYQDALRAFLLDLGCPRQEVDDVLHDFLTGRLLQGDFLRNVDIERGPFRCFLRTCLHRFLISHHRGKVRRQWIEPLETADEVAWATSGTDVARKLDRLWAGQVIANARARLRAEATAAGRVDWCAAMEELLDDDSSPGAVQEVARRLGMTPGAVSTASHRFRGRFRWFIHDEVRQTVREPADWKQELEHLVAALRA